MSDDGGIGGIGGPDPVPEGERLVPRRAAVNGAGSAPVDLELAEVLTALQQQGATLTEAVGALHEQIGAAEGRIAQLEAQAMRLETTVNQMVGQYNANFQVVFQRLDMLAQQLARNERLAALENATRSRQPGEGAGSVVKNAEAYVQFLTPPRPAEPERSATDGSLQSGPGLDEPPTQH